MELFEIIKVAPEKNQLITDSIVITHAKLKQYNKILCSISGGSDSDILIDLCEKFDESNKITYAFFDTGLEFNATKEHISYLENKYGVHVERIRAEKSIPHCCKTYGQPFISKQVSEWIERLQKHNFQWEEESFDVLYQRYPQCRAALRWWCNDFQKSETGKESSFNIAYNQYLKEFMITNPPTFKISNKCCYYAKKKVALKFRKQEKFDLNIYGVRKSEGGARRSAYKTCFSTNDDGDEYRPIFWYLNETKKIYEEHYNVDHSRCYSEYGLKRTGCAGCPFARNFEEELHVMKEYEPALFNAVNNVFKESYEYTRAYRRYIQQKRVAKEGITNGNTK
ncbi:MAG: phosphoadenosine phosphosulfate reductase family protein [Lachnospiraceae bacterium]|nr:phosphoadenosine phosphosulfate reductase family protein [Lachnospiraceae bacterium]